MSKINTNFFKAEVNSFVLNTSNDYDIHYHEVMKIYNNNKKNNVIDYEQFYKDLENWLLEHKDN